MSLLPVAEAQARLLALATPLPAEPTSLDDASGRFLAEALVARRDQPWSALSAMDGYAIRFADLPGPWTLAGAIQAGALPPTDPIAPGTAVRIFTGAPMPPGADTVVVQEDVSAQGDRVTLTGDGPSARERHVRPRASDFRDGQILLPAGTRIGAPQIALAALAGHGEMPVRAPPRVAILSTGDELIAPGAPCPPGKLPASNGIMLRAMAEAAGAQVVLDALVADDLASISAALASAGGADIIVTSGGASVGDHDLVRPALEAAGGTIDFWRIAMRPGKPLIVGRLGGALFLGLPGNPISALVTGSLFLLPLIRHLAGASDPLPRSRPMRLSGTLPATGTRADYLRARTDGDQVAPMTVQDSGAMTSAATAEALIVRPPGAPAAQNGDRVEVLDWAALGL